MEGKLGKWGAFECGQWPMVGLGDEERWQFNVKQGTARGYLLRGEVGAPENTQQHDPGYHVHTLVCKQTTAQCRSPTDGPIHSRHWVWLGEG